MKQPPSNIDSDKNGLIIIISSLFLQGLLTGTSTLWTSPFPSHSHLHLFGGSPIGSSRVKLTNKEDCVKRGFVKKGEDPLEVAAEQVSF